MKLNVTWSSSETKGWKRDNEPIGVVKKLEFFNIDITTKGLLDTFAPAEQATVYIHWSYRRYQYSPLIFEVCIRYYL